VHIYPTSIYSVSLYEAMSRVVQRALPELSALERLLDKLVVTCKMDKVYLFDSMSRVYYASDTHSVDQNTLSLCQEFVDMVCDLTVDQASGAPDNADELEEEKVPGLQEPGYNASIVMGGQLNSQTVYLHQVTKSLCMVAVLPNRMVQESRVLIEMNMEVAGRAIRDILGCRTS